MGMMLIRRRRRNLGGIRSRSLLPNLLLGLGNRICKNNTLLQIVFPRFCGESDYAKLRRLMNFVPHPSFNHSWVYPAVTNHPLPHSFGLVERPLFSKRIPHEHRGRELFNLVVCRILVVTQIVVAANIHENT
jgi:hypothetical protein